MFHFLKIFKYHGFILYLKFINVPLIEAVDDQNDVVMAAKPPMMAKGDQYKVPEAQKVRKEFPDTWLWGSGQTR